MDWNNDGYKDIIVGHYGVKTGTPTGKIHWFKGKSDGTLEVSEYLKYGNTEITDRYTAPCVVDWNNDGLLDLLVGSNAETPGNSKIMLFINEGTKEQYLFNEKRDLKTFDNAIIDDYAYGRVHVKVADLNNDGKKDLVCNGWGYGDNGERFYYYENIGTDDSVVLNTKFQLKEHDNSTSFTSKANYCNARFVFYDWNKDGFEDIIWADYRDNYKNPIYISLSSSDGPVAFLQEQKPKSNIKFCINNNKISFMGKVEKLKFNIFSINGKSVLSGTLDDATANTIKLNNLSQGNYFLRLSDGRGLLISRSIQIIK